MITAMISRLMILAFGTLYPAYASYKAVRTKDVKEYVKWMMYWIVFALFTCAETFTDVFFSFWFPFYYEIKVALVFWLLSPATKGSSFLYRNFVHPALQRRESEIDDMLSHAKEKGYNTVLSIGTKGVTYATNVLLQTAMRGGGGLVEHLKKSYSLTDLAPKVPIGGVGEVTDSATGEKTSLWVTCLTLLKDRNLKKLSMKNDATKDHNNETYYENLEARPSRSRRGIAGSAANLEMRFSEVDVNIRQCPPNDLLSDIRSSEDVSSGYSSTDQLYTEGVLTRSSSVSSTRRGRGGRTVQTRRAPLAEDSEDSDDDSLTRSSLNPNKVSINTQPSTSSNNPYESFESFKIEQEQLNVNANNETVIDQINTTSNIKDEATLSNIKDEATLSNIKDEATLSNIKDEATLSYIKDEATLSYIKDEATLSNIKDEAALSNIKDEATSSNIKDEATLNNIKEISNLSNTKEESDDFKELDVLNVQISSLAFCLKNDQEVKIDVESNSDLVDEEESTSTEKLLEGVNMEGKEPRTDTDMHTSALNSDSSQSSLNLDILERPMKYDEQNIASNTISSKLHEASLSKNNSRTSLSSSSSDGDRKGKYKKLPAPRPPSRELIDTVMKDLPELEKKLSDTEALMKKISNAHLFNINPDEKSSSTNIDLNKSEDSLKSSNDAPATSKPKLYRQTMV